MVHINVSQGDAVGLGKSKFFRKLSIKNVAKQVSIKNAVKVVKAGVPIAAGFIPLGGGVASKVTSKLLNSKVGKVVSKVKKSGLVKKAVVVNKKLKPVKALAKSNRLLRKGSKGPEVKALQQKLGVQADGDFGPQTEAALQQATGATTIVAAQVAPAVQAVATPVQTAPTEEALYQTPPVQATARPEVVYQTPAFATPPVQATARPGVVYQTPAFATPPFLESADAASQAGNFIPVAPVATNTTAAPAKNNTLLIVGGVVVAAGVVYLATRKK